MAPDPKHAVASARAARQLSNGSPALSVVTTCLNEADNIDTLVHRTMAMMNAAGIDGELVIVDDGSADGTWERIDAARRREPRVNGARHAENRGMERGWRTGLSLARGRAVCLIDADLQNRPEDIPALWQRWLADPERIVQGSRRPVNPPWSRYLLSRGLNVLLNVAFGMRLRDNKSGFVLCARETLQDVLGHRFNYRYFQCFLAVSAHAKGYTFDQLDTPFEPRQGGGSFLSTFPATAIGRTLWELGKARIEFRTNRVASVGKKAPAVGGA